MPDGFMRGALSALSCLVLLGCSGSDVERSSLSNDGVWAYVEDGTQHRRTDLAFFFFDTDCALDPNNSTGLIYLGEPAKLLATDEYLGTALYAAPPGPRTIKLAMSKDIDGHHFVGRPDKSATFQARHFYGFDCTIDVDGKIAVTLIDRDHISERR